MKYLGLNDQRGESILPKKVTSVYQPCDQQLFYSLKRKFRSLLAAHKAKSISEAYHDALCSVESLDTITPDMKSTMQNMISGALGLYAVESDWTP